MPGIIGQAIHENLENTVTLLGDSVLESEIVLTALMESCSTDEEFSELLEQHAVEMELFGIIDNSEEACEAARNIVRLNKSAKFSAIEKRAAIRLAKKADDPLYTKYAKYRALWKDFREKIFAKYRTKATREAKTIIVNARRKASGMSVDSGKSLTDRMDREIERVKESK